MEEEKKDSANWIEAMIEREAIPKPARTDTIAEFCAKWGIPESTYSYQSSKSDNWKRILEISLNSAKKKCPEILEVLGEKAMSGDMKAIDMYLSYIIQLAKNLDIKSDGKSIDFKQIIYARPDELIDNPSNSETASSL